MFKSWFVDFEPFGGTAPEDWSISSLGTIANITSGKRPLVKSSLATSETPIPIVGASSVMGYTSSSNHTEKILITGRVGTHGIVQRFNTPCWTSDNTLVITSDYYEYTFQILKGIDYSAMNRGSTQPLITQGDMNKVEVLLPDKCTLQKFETIVGCLMKKHDSSLIENDKLSSARDTLLPKLMSGEIDVSNVSI